MLVRRLSVAFAAIVVGATLSVVAGGRVSATNAVGFSLGELQAARVGSRGCGVNADGEPAVRVSPANNVIVASERNLGNGTDVWRGVQPGGPATRACGLVYGGQPNAVQGAGAAGGDVDVAIGSAPLARGVYRVYVASLNGGSVAVAHSDNNGAAWTNVPVQAGLPGDDREWIAAFGASTSLLTFHDAAGNIDVLRSDGGGVGYVQIAQAISPTDPAATNNELGNVAIDRHNRNGTHSGSLGQTGFWAYQTYVSASNANATALNAAYLAVSNDGGFTWTDHKVACSVAAGSIGLDHAFPNVSVDPAGHVWLAWSAGRDNANGFNTAGSIRTAVSTNHGKTWSCSKPIATGQAIYPWLTATTNGVDLVFYKQTSRTSTQSWAVAYAQNRHPSTSPVINGWTTPQLLLTVHHGAVCEGGIACTNGRQLLDDFGIATDQHGYAHIAYTHDAPCSAGDTANGCSSTGYAVQTSGPTIGPAN